MILIGTDRVIADVGSMTSDITKWSDAVDSVFKVLDCYTRIEPKDPNGHQPEKIIGQVEIPEVDFAYPTRPDVLVFKIFSINREARKSNGTCRTERVRQINYHWLSRKIQQPTPRNCQYRQQRYKVLSP